jgi:hypothetical protein
MKGDERAREGWAGLHCEDGSSSEMRREEASREAWRRCEEMEESMRRREHMMKRRLMGTFDGRNQNGGDASERERRMMMGNEMH